MISMNVQQHGRWYQEAVTVLDHAKDKWANTEIHLIPKTTIASSCLIEKNNKGLDKYLESPHKSIESENFVFWV